VESRVPLNYGVLCHFADRLTGIFILIAAHSFRSGRLHNVTLPRSWFVELWPDFRRSVARGTPPPGELCSVLNLILQDIYSGTFYEVTKQPYGLMARIFPRKNSERTVGGRISQHARAPTTRGLGRLH